MLEYTLFRLVRMTVRSSLEPRHVIRSQLVRLVQTSSQQQRDDGCGDVPEEPPMKLPYYIVGALLLGTGVVIAHAKQDDDFRSLIQENAPHFDKFISFITAEEVSHVDYIMKVLSNFKDLIVEDLSQLFEKQLGHDPNVRSKKSEVCQDEGKPFRVPSSAFKELSCMGDHDSYEEARTSEVYRGAEEIKKVQDSNFKDKKQLKKLESNSLNPNSLFQLEKDIYRSAETAIRSYILAGCFLRGFVEDVIKLLNVSIEKADNKLWSEVKKKGDERNAEVEKAENAAKAAEEQLRHLEYLLDEPDLPGGEGARKQTKKNIGKVLKQLEKAKEDYENERNNASIVERLWTKVLEARKHFMDEIETLHPQFRLTDREIKLPEAEMNIFINNAVMNALHLQTEFLKMDTVGKTKLRSVLEMSWKGDPDAVESAIELELEKEKRKVNMEYYKKLLTLKAECEHTTQQAIADQGISFEDILEEALSKKEEEVMMKLSREFDESLMEEKEKQRQDMAILLGRLKGMDDLMRERSCLKDSKNKLMWSATEALQAAITSSNDHSKTLKPLDMEIKAIKNLISDDDKFVETVLAAVPREAVERGVYSTPALKERFINVHRIARKVGFLPNGGASLPVMLVHYLKALIIVQPSNPIPCYELLNEPFDPQRLDNFEILQRTKFYMDKGDWYMVLGYMNLLEGASRVVAQDFIEELKLFLEMKLIADSLLFNASAEYLAF